jgi:predicted GIY-YIG superfamily endonuclease
MWSVPRFDDFRSLHTPGVGAARSAASTRFHEDIRAAIQRESNIKHWPRAWKVKLILMENRGWRDLFEELNW